MLMIPQVLLVKSREDMYDELGMRCVVMLCYFHNRYQTRASNTGTIMDAVLGGLVR
jgi:hypothetical protein